MSEYECEHGRRIGKCADCEVKELQGELSDLEEDYKTEFNAAEDLRCVVEDKDAQIKKLTEALNNLKRQVIVRAGERKILETEDIRWVSYLLAEIKG